MAKSKLVQANKHIEEHVVGTYQKIEDGVVGAYKKVEDSFVDNFLTRDGESIEDAKARIAVGHQERADASVKEK